jgi:leukotriene-A4 hydrolase
MVEDMIGFGLENSFSSIFPDVIGRNPDDAFSELPYEKGF